jgi:hypothetical protein
VPSTCALGRNCVEEIFRVGYCSATIFLYLVWCTIVRTEAGSQLATCSRKKADSLSTRFQSLQQRFIPIKRRAAVELDLKGSVLGVPHDQDLGMSRLRACRFKSSTGEKFECRLVNLGKCVYALEILHLQSLFQHSHIRHK